MVMDQLNRVQYSYVNVEVLVEKPNFEKVSNVLGRRGMGERT
jgi:predicted RNA-binding protein with EMAP domain